MQTEEPEKPDGGKYAYVTMWLNKVKVPQHVFKRVLSKEETMALNAAKIDDNGIPILHHSLAETEGKPKKEEEKKPEKQKIPLRPRNSQWRGITDIAWNLRNVGSKYPLVVLTNEEIYDNKTLQEENPNIQFIWLNNETDFLERHCKIGVGHELHFQKLAIWKLTQFDKLLWLDTDIAFAKNVDYLFTEKKYNLKEGSRIFGQHDDYQCDGREWSPTSGGICSGMLLIKPSTYHFQGLMQTQSKMRECWGDQAIIGSYYHSGKNRAMAFSRDVINFARCSKKDGWMDVVHFSGSPNAKRVGDTDKRDKDGSILNATTIALKAAQKERKEALDEKKAAAKKERTEKRWKKAGALKVKKKGQKA